MTRASPKSFVNKRPLSANPSSVSTTGLALLTGVIDHSFAIQMVQKIRIVILLAQPAKLTPPE
jgi:hypothetical protein